MENSIEIFPPLYYTCTQLYGVWFMSVFFSQFAPFIFRIRYNQMQSTNGKFGNDRFRPPMNGNRNDFRNDRNASGLPSKPSQSQNGINLHAVDWTTVTLTPFRKNFYKPASNVSQTDIDTFLKTNEITMRGTELPSPNLDFHEEMFPDYVMTSVRRQGFEKPTAIQATSWPIALSGRDLVGIAKTGSGKTLAYVLPSLIHINNQERRKRGDGPIVLILAPTRELAQQIQQVCHEFGANARVNNTCIFGGAPKGPQVSALQRNYL